MGKSFPLRHRVARFLLGLLKPLRDNGCWNCARWNGEAERAEKGCKWTYTSAKCWCSKWRRKEGEK